VKLHEFFSLAIQVGIDADLRGRVAVEQDLNEVRRSYDDLKPDEKAVFDAEKLENPYTDSRILYGSHHSEIKKILAGIDIEAGELLLADRLNQKGAGIDLVVAHHPEGRAYANIYDVMKMQADILNRFGVPINVAENLLQDRMKEVERKLLPVNHTRAVDIARLLDIPFVCLHTPADNMVACYLQDLFDREKPRRLRDVMGLLRDIPEYREAVKNDAGPKILLGAGDQRSGKVFVDMTGGTEGSKDIMEHLSQSGVGTMVAMHLTEDHRKEAEKHYIHVVIAGHISSDTLGLNLLLDRIESREPLTVVECSGFKRIKRPE
jgi:hypothetical protein